MGARLRRRPNGRRATDARYQIRLAQLADVAQVASLERVVFTDPWSERDLNECVQTGVPFLVAEQGDAVIGYVIARHAVDEAEVLNLGVAQARQREGIGRALVQAMLARLRKAAVTTVFLEVRESNAIARRLYGDLGFVQVGRRRDYYRRPVEDAVILRATI